VLHLQEVSEPAAGEVRFLAPLNFGDTVRRESRIADVVMKCGKGGMLCFVTVEHLLTRGGTCCIEERQDIVYRGDPHRPAAVTSPVPVEPATHQEPVNPTPVMLFRYSAATANSHRIHYDRSYATEVEGYSGLVVHGPLTATLLADLARRTTGRELAGFRFRAQRPLFDTAPFTIALDRTGDDVSLRAVTPEGHIAMSDVTPVAHPPATGIVG
jgi:3-methylfumaryl-CoA hydratase